MRGAIALYALALLVALGLKLHYSAASADELTWVLAPTAALVELGSGADFVAETGVGYLSTELRFVIAPSCAGVNFLIVAFTALVFGLVRPSRSFRRNALVFAAGAVAAYATTIFANAVRILVAIELHERHVSWGWFTGDRLHVIAGVAVYLIALFALFFLARRVAREPVAAWVPLVPYVVVALAIPLLNGGHARAEFWAHAAIVIALVGAAVGVSVVVKRLVGART